MEGSLPFFAKYFCSQIHMLTEEHEQQTKRTKENPPNLSTRSRSEREREKVTIENNSNLF
jgi:hypothetical protein